MKRTTSLCFSKDGLINTSAIDYIKSNDFIDSIVLFGDGSTDAFDQMIAFCHHDVMSLNQIKKVGVGIIPKYDLRVVNADESISKPNFVFSDDVKYQWLCSKIAAPHIEIVLSDITSQSGTQVRLEKKYVEDICYIAHQLWLLLLIAESRLAFPAAVIDLMTKWNTQLEPNRIDIELLRKESGLETLDYNSHTDLLSVEVGLDIFQVKLSVLNDFYSKIILPYFTHIYGKNTRLLVGVDMGGGHMTEAIEMTYGQLGRIVENMRYYIKETLINDKNPMDPTDLINFARKVRISEESCIWAKDNETLEQVIEDYKDKFMRENNDNDTVRKYESILFDTDSESSD